MADQSVSMAGFQDAAPTVSVRQRSARQLPPGKNPVARKTSPRCASIDFGGLSRSALMLTPHPQGSFRRQAEEVLGELRSILAQSEPQPVVTLQTVFLKRQQDRAAFETLLRDFYGGNCPITAFVAQAPANGASLALEAWAVSGPDVKVERCGPRTLSVDCDGVRWIYCSGVESLCAGQGVYSGCQGVMEGLRDALALAGSSFEHVVRTWFYLGGITRHDGPLERYKEFNRARADFYTDIRFGHGLLREELPSAYPASTGIGMRGTDLVGSCIAVETKRSDAQLVRLENPIQTPAFEYHPRYSPKSPCFSRAMALVLRDQITTWVSGTASIVNSESQHVGNIEAQTHQTIDNIQRLLTRENFQQHGVPQAGAMLKDLAKVRVYIKRPQDFARCQAVCKERFGGVPAIYAVADVCRPELLVEIEGVAFSRRSGP
jgi:enamine deaminase RidA (YjgF/YER057c/UK114 family)